MVNPQFELQTKIDSIIQQHLPFSSFKLESRQSLLRRQWYIQAKRDLAPGSIPDNRLSILTQDFWNTNKLKEFIPPNSFYHALLLAIERERNHPNLRQAVSPSFSIKVSPPLSFKGVSILVLRVGSRSGVWCPWFFFQF